MNDIQQLTQPYKFELEGTFEGGNLLKLAEILTFMSNYNPRQSREGLYDVRAFKFSHSRIRI